MKKWKVYWLEVKRIGEFEESSLFDLIEELKLNVQNCEIYFNEGIILVLPFEAPPGDVVHLKTIIKALKIWDKNVGKRAKDLEKLIKQLDESIVNLRTLLQPYCRVVFGNEEGA